MSPFVKLGRSTKKKKDLPVSEGLFSSFAIHCSLSWCFCTVLPTNTHIQVACHFLNQNESVKHLYKCLCHSKVFTQTSSSLLLGLN